MSSQIGIILAKRRIQTLEVLHYHLLSRLVPLLCYLDDQLGEFLKLMLDLHGFKQLTNLIKYYTTTRKATLVGDLDYLV